MEPKLLPEENTVVENIFTHSLCCLHKQMILFFSHNNEVLCIRTGTQTFPCEIHQDKRRPRYQNFSLQIDHQFIFLLHFRCPSVLQPKEGMLEDPPASNTSKLVLKCIILFSSDRNPTRWSQIMIMKLKFCISLKVMTTTGNTTNIHVC